MRKLSIRRPRWRWQLGLLAVLAAFTLGFAAVWTNALGAGDRFDRMVARIEAIVDPPPNRPTVPTILVTSQPSPSLAVSPSVQAWAEDPIPHVNDVPHVTPAPTPRPRVAVDVNVVGDPEAVFISQITNKMCAVAGTQMALVVMGLGDNSEAFQNELAHRIGDWESWEDSHNGGWGPAAISLALAAYGAPGYEIRAYDVRADALRDAAVALSATGRPVILLPWWGAHTWVMTGYQADADPTYFADATVTGTYILDPWYPRVSSIWGASDPPGTFQDAAEMERNFIGWSRPEGAYPGRDGKYVVVLPTTPLQAATAP
jgi:hypothetical protein